MLNGRIIRQISNDYSVLTDEGTIICKPRGKFRNENIHPLVGDFVQINPETTCILTVFPRKNELIRPPIANIDQAFLITSVHLPNLDLNLLDKMLLLITYHNIEPCICFTKLDLLENCEKVEPIMHYYEQIGYSVFSNSMLEPMKQQLQGKITVFTGQSGAGKSTLLNRLDPHFNLLTDEISIALGRGKHTTRHVELLPILGGMIADTPGFSSLDFQGMKKIDIRDCMKEFVLYQDLCGYRDCMHVGEEDCEVKRQVKTGNILKSRYENYLKFLEKVTK